MVSDDLPIFRDYIPIENLQTLQLPSQLQRVLQGREWQNTLWEDLEAT
jgi:hypothetical protein